MNPYYQSLLKDIVTLFAGGEYEEADSLIKKELELPYIPAEAQEILENYRDECAPHLVRSRPSSRYSLEELIHGDERQKEMAASLLQSMNLRQYHSEVQQLLNASDLVQEFKGELIEALMSQRIAETYSIVPAGESKPVEFVPDDIIPADKDPVIIRTREYFSDWLEAGNPSMADFCRQLLEQEILEMRPRDFRNVHPRELAASIVRLVFQAMQDPEGWEKFEYEWNLQTTAEYPLYIEKRGE